MDPQQECGQQESPFDGKVEATQEKEATNNLSADPEDSAAVKGNDSDGHVHWTFRQILATVSLCGLYVGTLLLRLRLAPQACHTHISLPRVTTPATFCRRESHVHRRRHGRRIGTGLGACIILTRTCISRSTLWPSAGYVRPSKRRSLWEYLDLWGYHHCGYSPQASTGDSWHDLRGCGRCRWRINCSCGVTISLSLPYRLV